MILVYNEAWETPSQINRIYYSKTSYKLVRQDLLII